MLDEDASHCVSLRPQEREKMATIEFVNVTEDDYSVSVHKAGCPGLRREVERSPFLSLWDIQREVFNGSKQDFFEEYNGDFLDDPHPIRFHSCTDRILLGGGKNERSSGIYR